jgi:hypothetical protein
VGLAAANGGAVGVDVAAGVGVAAGAGVEVGGETSEGDGATDADVQPPSASAAARRAPASGEP